MLGDKTRQGGIAIVEFTLVLPLLLLLMLASAEIGRALFQYDAVTKGAQDAARFVASKALAGSTGVVVVSQTIPECDCALQTAAARLVRYGNVFGTGTPLVPNLSDGDVSVTSPGAGLVSISVAWTYTPLVATALPDFYGSPISLSIPVRASVVMQAL